MACRFVSVLCCLLIAAAVGAQSIPPTEIEQVEQGTVPSVVSQKATASSGLPAGPPEHHYRIRLLPVSSFPRLPALVAQQLERRGCMIPQTYEAHEPENVIEGSFEKTGSSDWAALCSVNHITTLYVFFQSNMDHPIALRHQADTEWLGVEWSLDYGSAWGIATRPAHLMPPPGRADHAGIDDSFVEKSTTVHYFENGAWTTRDLGE